MIAMMLLERPEVSRSSSEVGSWRIWRSRVLVADEGVNRSLASSVKFATPTNKRGQIYKHTSLNKHTPMHILKVGMISNLQFQSLVCLH